jgi:hypothetical protein
VAVGVGVGVGDGLGATTGMVSLASAVSSQAIAFGFARRAPVA